MAIDWTKPPSFEEIINDKEIQSALSKKYTECYIKDEINLFTNLNHKLNMLDPLIERLKTIGVDLNSYPWYKDLCDIYIPKATQHFNKVIDKSNKCDIVKEDETWFRESSDAFFSNVEKFTKFIVLEIFGKKPKDWNDAIENLNNIKMDNIIKSKFGNDQKLNKIIDYVVFTLHQWRMLYNANKHDTTKEKNSVLEKQKESTIIFNGNDILDLTHEFVNIIYLLLPFVFLIKSTKNT